MALNVALGEPQWAAARVLHSPLSGEVAARLCVIAGLKRRLARNGRRSSDILERATCQAEQIGASAGGDAEVPEGKPVVAANHDVAEGERRLAAAGDVGENTRRAYESALRGLDAWLGECREGVALNDTLLAEYLAVLAAQGRCVSSAAQVVAAVKRCAKEHGDESPVGERTAEALARYRRVAHEGPGQVRGNLLGRGGPDARSGGERGRPPRLARRGVDLGGVRRAVARLRGVGHAGGEHRVRGRRIGSTAVAPEQDRPAGPRCLALSGASHRRTGAEVDCGGWRQAGRVVPPHPPRWHRGVAGG